MLERHYLNLTNGIEALPKLQNGESWGFLRIQSTALEQKRWAFVLDDLDYDFLMNVALGVECHVWDFSNRKKTPRSLYQGLPWIRYALSRSWHIDPEPAIVRGHNCDGYFRDCYANLPEKTLNRMLYPTRLCRPGTVRIADRGGQTRFDGKDDYYAEVLKSEGMVVGCPS